MIRNITGQPVGCNVLKADGTDFSGAVTVYIDGDQNAQVQGAVGAGAAIFKGNGAFLYVPSADETNFAHVDYIFKPAAGGITAAVHYDTITAAQYASVQVQAGTAADYTVRNLITDALNDLGVYGPVDGDVEYDDLAMGMRHLVLMTDSFQAQRLLLWTVVRTTFSLVANQRDYTIGLTGSNVTAGRPIWIASAKVIPVGDTQELPLHLFTRAEWFAEPFKTLKDQWPRALLYEPTGAIQGTFTVWPVPTTAATIVYATPSALQVPATLDTVLSFPPGYLEAWQMNLALRLARPFRTPATQELKEAAKDALGVIKRLNDEGPPPSKADLAVAGRGRWDIFSNQWGAH